VERVQLCKSLRDLLDGTEVFGGGFLQLSASPVDASAFPGQLVAPPPLRLRARNGDLIIPAPERVTRNDLQDRARRRADQIRDHGFLEARPITPLLACPRAYGPARAKRLQQDLNRIWADQRFHYRFDRFELYRDEKELRRHVEQGEYDAVLVVLPEDSRQGQHDHDTHERIKQTLDVPSQCIHHDNTLSPYLASADVAS
jgi:hypothetical protein